MNMTAVITAAVFLLVSIAVLIYLFVGKSSFASGSFRVFYRASCGVYVSGALLILVFTLIMAGLPVAFVVISDVTILFVFCFTCGLIYYMTKTIVEASNRTLVLKDDENKEESKQT